MIRLSQQYVYGTKKKRKHFRVSQSWRVHAGRQAGRRMRQLQKRYSLTWSISIWILMQPACCTCVKWKFTYQKCAAILLPHKTQIKRKFQWSLGIGQIDEFLWSTWSWCAITNLAERLYCAILWCEMIVANYAMAKSGKTEKEMKRERDDALHAVIK